MQPEDSPQLAEVHTYNVSYRTLKTKSQGKNGLTKEGVKAAFEEALEKDFFAWFFVERDDITATGHLPK